jgi:hypothetical protein
MLVAVSADALQVSRLRLNTPAHEGDERPGSEPSRSTTASSPYQSLASEFQRRPDVVQAFAPHHWSVAAIDLTVPILSFQSLVHIEDAVLYSDRPPQLTDFLDDRISLEVTDPSCSKGRTDSAEEFVVPV